ncbi:PQQ-binding-like beta-propeller repeat protein [Planctomycetota bacterium]
MYQLFFEKRKNAVLCIIFIILFAGISELRAADDITGDWEFYMSIPEIGMDIISWATFTKNEDGSYECLWDQYFERNGEVEGMEGLWEILETQSFYGTVSDIKFDDPNLTFVVQITAENEAFQESSSPPGSFSGTITGDKIEGAYSGDTGSIPMTGTRTKPPTDPLGEENIQVDAGFSADSPRFRGLNGDGQFDETGLMEEWSEEGPRLVWSVDNLGKGYSSATIADETVYVTGMDEQANGWLYAFNLDGTEKWKTNYGPEMEETGPAVAGTRGTPAIDGDRIFVVSSFGKFIIFETTAGEIIETIDLLERFDAEQLQFGFAESPLFDGDKVICTPGGNEATVVALNRNTGETIWQSEELSLPSGYCSARIITHAGKKQIVTMLDNSIISLDPNTGELLWQANHEHRAGVQPNPPLYQDGMIYVSSGMGTGGQMLEISPDSKSATSKWTDSTLDCQMHGLVLIDGYIYGTASSGQRGLVCLEMKSGEVMWNQSDIGQGVVVSADGMLYVYGADGNVHLIKPDSEKYSPISMFAVTMGTDEHWAHPTITGGRLYIRHGDVLMTYDIKEDS